MKILFKKISNLFIYALLYIIQLRVSFIKAPIKDKTLLLVRLDAIGDYVLFRNFLEIIKKSQRFSGYKITLCGNIIWKEIAENFDKQFVDEFVWVNRKKYFKSFSYKYSLLKTIKQSGFETAIDLAYSREILYGDSIIRASSARIKIGSTGAQDKHVVWKRKIFSKNIYTEIIPLNPENLFEFNRNKEYLEAVLHEKINITAPSIDVSAVKFETNKYQPYAIIFFGASTKEKIWDLKNFIEIAGYLRSKYGLNVVLDGGNKEIPGVLPAGLFNVCGQTTLSQLAKVISDSEILISNETVAVHLSAAVKKKFVCVSNGERIKRFHPYPRDIFNRAFYIYPEPLMSSLDKDDFLERFRYGSNLNINTIDPSAVKEAINKVMQDYKRQ